MKIFQKRRLLSKSLLVGCCLCCFMSVACELKAQEPSEALGAAQPENTENTLLWLGFLLLGCFLLAGKYASTQIWRKHSLSAKDIQQLREMRQRMLQNLAALDDNYDPGQLDRQAYATERARRKEELVELTLFCRNFPL